MDNSSSMTARFDMRFDRVREQSAPEVNRQIDLTTAHNLQLYSTASRELISKRLEELDQEWDIERTLELNAASVALGGLALGALGNRKWFALPMVVSGFLMQHAIQGWCPPLAIFRRRGVRTRKEIERERYGLKLLRGDFDGYHSGEKADVTEILKLLDL